MKEDNELEKAKTWWDTKNIFDRKKIMAKYFGACYSNSDETILELFKKEGKDNPTCKENLQVHELEKAKQEHESVMQQCESCQKEFDIDTMVNAEQYFCQPCYDELSESPDFSPTKQEREEEVEYAFGYNFEREEMLRQSFVNTTKNKLWCESFDNDAGFAEEYVFWLENHYFSFKSQLQQSKKESESSINELVEALKGLLDWSAHLPNVANDELKFAKEVYEKYNK